MTIDLIKVLSKPTTNNFRYHVGSLAFGALILTLVQAVRILLEYIDHKTRSKASHLMSTMLRYRPPPPPKYSTVFIELLKFLLFFCLINSHPAAQNACARFILCCMKCCFWCLEKFIKFLNRNAYIMVSSTGVSNRVLSTHTHDMNGYQSPFVPRIFVHF